MSHKIPNTFGISATCNSLIEFKNTDELLSLLPQIEQARRQGKLLIIGRGSNLLPTSNYDGTIVRSRLLCKQVLKTSNDNVLIRCGSGETVDDIISWCIAQGIYGMENLSLIPGEVGASAVQNIGAYGVEIQDIVDNIEAIEISTGKNVIICNNECNYAYRYSRFKDEWKNKYIITYVTYRLSTTFSPKLDYGTIRQSLAERNIQEPTAQQLRETIISIRQSKLPDFEKEGNAGSFFMNPIISKDTYENLHKKYPDMPFYELDDARVKVPAGWMIETCGWKGKRKGNAGVHDKQALVLVNKGGATGKEVLELCSDIQKDVKSTFGIEIIPEVNII